VFRVTTFALKMFESPETVSWVTFAPVKTFKLRILAVAIFEVIVAFAVVP